MKRLLIFALFLGACSKSSDNDLASPTGVYYVNGVARVPDSIKQWQPGQVSFIESNTHYIQLNVASLSQSRVDSINDYSISAGVYFTLGDGGKSYRTTEQDKKLTSTYNLGKMTFQFSDVEMISPDSQFVKVSGTLIYNLP